MAYSRVSDYIAAARTLLQDTVSPYRYEDAGLVEGLNNALDVVARLRPDILLWTVYAARMPRRRPTLFPASPVFSANDLGATVVFPQKYQQSVLYFIVGYAQLRDTEDVQDARATSFMGKLTQDLLSLM